MVVFVISGSVGVAERSGATLPLLMQQGPPPPVVMDGTCTLKIYEGIMY
jgi:hypothetical protein